MTWEEYYEKIWEWTPSTMVKHMPELTSNVSSEMNVNCEESELIWAIKLSADNFTDEDMEDLSYGYDEDLIMEIAKKYNLRLPEELREDYENIEDDYEEDIEEENIVAEATFKLSQAQLQEAYEYVLQCLNNAHKK